MATLQETHNAVNLHRSRGVDLVRNAIETQKEKARVARNSSDATSNKHTMSAIEFGFAFLVVAGGNLLGWLLAFVTGGIGTFVINYFISGSLWFWAKINDWQPPTFGSLLNGTAGRVANIAVPETRAASEVLSIAENIPGSDLLYVLLGGVSPIPYLIALYMNNRA